MNDDFLADRSGTPEWASLAESFWQLKLWLSEAEQKQHLWHSQTLQSHKECQCHRIELGWAHSISIRMPRGLSWLSRLTNLTNLRRPHCKLRSLLWRRLPWPPKRRRETLNRVWEMGCCPRWTCLKTEIVINNIFNRVIAEIIKFSANLLNL